MGPYVGFEHQISRWALAAWGRFAPTCDAQFGAIVGAWWNTHGDIASPWHLQGHRGAAQGLGQTDLDCGMHIAALRAGAPLTAAEQITEDVPEAEVLHFLIKGLAGGLSAT